MKNLGNRRFFWCDGDFFFLNEAPKGVRLVQGLFTAKFNTVPAGGIINILL